MSLKTFNKTLTRSSAICEAAAAAVAELTNQSRNSDPATDYTWSVPAGATNFGQLKTELLRITSPMTVVTLEGDSIVITSRNEAAVKTILLKYGFPVELTGGSPVPKTSAEV